MITQEIDVLQMQTLIDTARHAFVLLEYILSGMVTVLLECISIEFLASTSIMLAL